MLKQDAIELFGGVSEMAQALACNRQTIELWSERLTIPQSDRVIGAGLRLHLIKRAKAEALINEHLKAAV